MREDDRQLAVAFERPLAGQELEEDAAERVDIGAAVDLAALDLLRRDVVDRPDEAALARQAADRRDVPCKSEVADVCVFAVRPRRDEDVPRLHVAVDEAGAVCFVERTRDLRDQRHRPRCVEASVAAQDLAKVGAVGVRHREVEQAVLVARSDRPCEVRVVELSSYLRLAQEAFTEARVARQLGRKDLQRDLCSAVDVLREVDGAHRPGADHPLDAEVGDQLPAVDLGCHLR